MHKTKLDKDKYNAAEHNFKRTYSDEVYEIIFEKNKEYKSRRVIHHRRQNAGGIYLLSPNCLGIDFVFNSTNMVSLYDVFFFLFVEANHDSSMNTYPNISTNRLENTFKTNTEDTGLKKQLYRRKSIKSIGQFQVFFFLAYLRNLFKM